MRGKIKYIIFNLFGEEILAKLRIIYWTRRLKKDQFYEKEIDLLPRLVRCGDIAVDIGANFGQYTYPLSRLVGPTGKVFSFEPVKYTFEILRDVVRKLKLTNVEIRNIALGNKRGETEIVIPVDSSSVPDISGSHLRGQEENKESKRETVKVTTLDKLMLSLPLLNKVAFIKCDVEGAEIMVFKGAKKLLSKNHPIVLCEIERRHTKRYKYDPRELFIFFKSLGYNAFIFAAGSLVPVQNIRKSTINYIFVHKSLMDKYKNG